MTQAVSPDPGARDIRCRLALARLSGIEMLPRHRPYRSLQEVEEAVKACTRCAISARVRNRVFGEGNPRAACMFVGEAPGEEEDLQGRPFVGQAGKLLTAIITKGMRLKREDVYIANVLKCRPPFNRNPAPEEIANCMEFLHAQIEAVRPKVIVALGGFAARALLEVDEGVSRLRGTFHAYRGIPLMPTYHPGYLLRNPSQKVKVWEDIKKVMALLGISVKE